MQTAVKFIGWLGVSLLGAWAYAVLAWHHGESLNSVYILIAALCTYVIGYRFYSKWIAVRVLGLDNRRATPCEVHDDGKDFVRTNKWIVFGHHFAAIAGPGPLVGPVLAAQFGYLPGMLWILIGVVLGGAVQDFVILFCSLRRDGRSLAQMVREEVNTPAGVVAVVAILSIMTVLLAVLALVVVKALAESPWGVFTVGATIPIAMLMGGYMRFWRIGKVLEASVMGVVLLLLAVWGGKLVYASPDWSKTFALGAEPLAWVIILYGLAASVLPVWLLLAPRDYLSTFMKLGTIFLLAIGIFFVLPDLKMPALSRFIDGSGPVLAGKLFPFCFITIACGAISGFHTLIASGTTPKLITREGYTRPIGYGAMCLESLVAIMALIAACTLEPGIYLSMNIKGAPVETVALVNTFGFPVTVVEMDDLARTIGEHTLFGRTGGAATLAVGMAKIFSGFVSRHGLDLWYHFAIMFEALFILTTLDAGTRVGRYLLQDALAHVWKPFGDTKRIGANFMASSLTVAGWGYFLIQGVRDPLGGVNSLWPLFGIANQLLSVVALCLATTIILKMQLKTVEVSPLQNGKRRAGRPAFALITLVPLVWLLAVTVTAGLAKISSSNPNIGFLAQARSLEAHRSALQAALRAAQQTGDAAAVAAAHKRIANNRSLHFNSVLDAVVAGVFLALVAGIVFLSIREWTLLLSRRRQSRLGETPPVWLPECAVAEGQPKGRFRFLALALALANDVPGDAQLQPASQMACQPGAACFRPGAVVRLGSGPAKLQGQFYARMLERRYSTMRRCC